MSQSVDSETPSFQVDPEKMIQQLQSQRNSALDQAAQCVAVIEMLDEKLSEVSEQLAEAHQKIADLENKQKVPAHPESTATSA